MNITVVGFGHFAGVVASCLAEQGHGVWQRDEPPDLIREGQRRPESEPGYVPYVPMQAPPDLVWVAYDCPLDADGAPVVDEILNRIERLHVEIPPRVPFLVSCQWPVGTLAALERRCQNRDFYYVLENVRVGKAITDFRHQTAIIVGSRQPLRFSERELVLKPFADTIVKLSPESAEMAKHATNAFMALQVAFANEIAKVCAHVGADSDGVMGAVKMDGRVSPRAPLMPGAPFGGGSLQRDLLILERLIVQHRIDAPILLNIRASNEVLA